MVRPAAAAAWEAAWEQLAQAMTEMLDRMLSTGSGRPLAADAGRIVTGA